MGPGYQFQLGWDVTWNYTYFRTKDAGTVSAASNPGLELVATRSFYDFPVKEIQASAALDYDVHDIEVGRWLPAGDSAAIRIFGGFRWATIDQQIDTRYEY